MGLLTTGGAPLRWGSEANDRAVPVIVEHGIQQFLNIYKNKRDLRNCPFIWGEEIEAQLVHIDRRTREVRLCLDAGLVLDRLRTHCGDVAVWQPEYGSFMVESTPAQPYTLDAASMATVEANMRARYRALDAHAGAGTIGVTLVTFPLMGVGEFVAAPLTNEQKRLAATSAVPAASAVSGGSHSSSRRGGSISSSNGAEEACHDNDTEHGSRVAVDAHQRHHVPASVQPLSVHDVSPFSLSLFVPDVCINQTHPRFATLTQNIRLRRGRKVCIQVPLYIDRHTLTATVDTRLNIDAHPRNKDINCGLVNNDSGNNSNNSNNKENNTTNNNNNNSNSSSHDNHKASSAGVPRRTRRFGDEAAQLHATATTVSSIATDKTDGVHATRDGSSTSAIALAAATTTEAAAAAAAAAMEAEAAATCTTTAASVATRTTLSATTAAATHVTHGATNGTASLPVQVADTPHTCATASDVGAAAPELSPATLYYYAQYFTGKQSEYVKARYDSCPCPARWVHQPCVYMDCMAFGMGCNCLQVTMQMADEPEARYAYDQLAILAPVFLAITSATPFQKGLLCDSDVRWLTIAASVDDRQPSEFPRIVKSRYDSISTFIARDAPALEQFNDTDIAINETCYAALRAHDVDARLARHIAHLFIRDPLTIFDQLIDVDDATSSVHFENIQTTNWQSVRFKPPPVGGNIGWRVEFRVMEVMPTPFENAAFALFVALLAAAIVKYKPIFYTRVSVVDENIGRAHRIHPCRELYKMRKHIFGEHDADSSRANQQQQQQQRTCEENESGHDATAHKDKVQTYTSSEAEVGLFSVNEIFNGREDGYVGLIPLVRRYVRDTYSSHDDDNGGGGSGGIPHLETYLRFISMRASGQIPTTAQYLRQFVTQHSDYRHDSRLTTRIAYDLVTHIHGLATGEVEDDAYLPMHAFRANKRAREGDDDDTSSECARIHTHKPTPCQS